MEYSNKKVVTLELGLFKSKKTEKVCACLCADLGYKKLMLSFDEAVIVETLGMSFVELNDLKTNFLLSPNN